VYHNIEKYSSYLAIALGFIALLTAYLLFSSVTRGITIDTDLRALLPEAQSDSLEKVIDEKFHTQFNNKIIIATSSPELSQAKAAADRLASHLESQSDGLLRIQPAINSELPNLFESLKDHRFHLLTHRQKELISQDHDLLIEDAWRALFSFESIAHTSAIKDDPLNLFNDYLKSLNTVNQNFSYSPPFLVVEEDDLNLVILIADVSQNALSLRVQEKITTIFEEIEASIQSDLPDVRIIKSGMIFHAAEAAATAKKEITYITIISILGIIILYILSFRSLMPLVLSLLSVGFGWLSAFAICNYIFSNLHIITLVFGATLIGISIDYSLHYFTKLYNKESWNHRFQPLISIISAITLGLTTSVLGYGSLILAPLPGLSQVAVFSITGLICSWLFAVVVYPRLEFKHRIMPPQWLITLSLLPQYCWQCVQPRVASMLMLAVFLGSAGIFLTATSFSDNPRLLHKPSQELLNNDRAIQQALKQYNANQFIVITANTEQKVLQKEEAVTKKLDLLIEQADLGAYKAVSQYVPSVKEQKNNYQLLKTHLYHSESTLTNYLQELGYEQDRIEQHLFDFSALSNNVLTPNNGLGAKMDQLSLMWLGKVDNRYASLILLRDINNTKALLNITENGKGIFLLNKTERLQKVLGEQQYYALKLLVIAYLIVMVVLVIRYRSLKAAGLVLVPITSTLVALALFGMLDIPVTLFHTFALFLILGLGLDYSIFIYESSNTDHSANLAIMLSAGTSCLSFGMLALSQTPMVSNFGCAILIGSLFNLILAPFVSQLHTKKQSDNVSDSGIF